MNGRNRSNNRRHLRSVPGQGPTLHLVPRPPSPAQLSARIVSAAQAWAAVVLAVPSDLSPQPFPLTEEELRRRELLDAVHDLEFHSAEAVFTAVPLPLEFPDGHAPEIS